MLIVKASKNSEGVNLPNPELMKAMTRCNEALIKVDVRVMVKGLHRSSNGMRISVSKSDEEPVITQGPFTKTKDLIAEFIFIEVNSKEEAIEWAMRMPAP